MKKFAAVFFLFFSVCAFADLFSNYNYITPEDLVDWLKGKKQFFILDIQPKKAFDDEHIVGAIPTYAFPAKTDEEKKRLDPVIENIKKSSLPVVVVCPAGKTGAKNTYNYLKSKSVDEKRLYILKGGMGNWIYEEFSEPK